MQEFVFGRMKAQETAPEPYTIYDKEKSLEQPKPENMTLRDFEYFKSMYPARMKELQVHVEAVCDEMDYAGSSLYDEYPDRVMVEQLRKKVEQRLAKEEAAPPVTEELQTETMTGGWQTAVEVSRSKSQVEAVAPEMESAWSEAGITWSEDRIARPETGITRSEDGIIRSEVEIARPEAGITRSEDSMVRPEAMEAAEAKEAEQPELHDASLHTQLLLPAFPRTSNGPGMNRGQNLIVKTAERRPGNSWGPPPPPPPRPPWGPPPPPPPRPPWGPPPPPPPRPPWGPPPPPPPRPPWGPPPPPPPKPPWGPPPPPPPKPPWGPPPPPPPKPPWGPPPPPPPKPPWGPPPPPPSRPPWGPPPHRPDNKNFLGDIISLLLFGEMQRRRCRNRVCG